MTTTETEPRAPGWAAVLIAAVSGPILAAAFPALGWWPLAFVGIAGMLVALKGRSVEGALLVGFIAGAAFYFSSIYWIALYLGPLPLIALSVFESMFFAVGSLLITLAYRWVPRAWPGSVGRFGLLPVIVAGLWTARESAASVWPYGGFPWSRVAHSQSQSPFTPLVAWLGFAGLTFAIVLVSAVVLECILAGHVRLSTRVVIAVGLVAAELVIPAWPVETAGRLRVGAVQGNGPAGYFEPSRPGDVMNAQLAASAQLVGDRVDVVVWPEGSADIDPTRSPASAAALDALSTTLGAPIVGGTVTHRDGKYYNTSFLWEGGRAQQLYDKRHPIPFGEYVPDRDFWEPFAPDLLGLIQRQYTPGTLPNVFDVDGVDAGISICFDIADDQLLTDMIHGGAEVIFAQTNNADFGETEENVQQLAIARLRAVESARSLVNISTVGTSQMIAPDGRTLTSLKPYTPGAMVADVPLATTITPAVLASRGLELLVCGLGVFGLLIAAIANVTARRRRRRG